MAESNIQEIILIGRDTTCNFIVEDTSVSRNHAQIINYGSYVSVIDLGSANGTYVNGKKVTSETTLHSGDELRVGQALVPWEQLVTKSKSGGKKSWLWILIVGVALLLLAGAGVAAYFLWIHSDLEKTKQSNENLYEEVIDGVIKTDSLQQVADSLEKETQRQIEEAQSRIDNANRKAEEAEREAATRQQKAEKKASEAKEMLDEAAKMETQAKEKLETAEQKEKEAANKETQAKEKLETAEQKEKEAAKKVEEANEALKKAEEIKQDDVMKLIDALSDEDAGSICKSLGIKYQIPQKPAKKALKEEFNTSERGGMSQQRIAKALKEKQKNSK